MGLPIVKQITRLHGGGVVLESEVGKGTTVTLRLPLYDEGRSG
jgi:signal transduction histidine kinase